MAEGRAENDRMSETLCSFSLQTDRLAGARSLSTVTSPGGGVCHTGDTHHTWNNTETHTAVLSVCTCQFCPMLSCSALTFLTCLALIHGWLLILLIPPSPSPIDAPFLLHQKGARHLSVFVLVACLPPLSRGPVRLRLCAVGVGQCPSSPRQLHTHLSLLPNPHPPQVKKRNHSIHFPGLSRPWDWVGWARHVGLVTPVQADA